jgi:hypothetical protein
MNDNFPWTEQEFSEKVRNAVSAYWRARKKQAKRQNKAGRPDAGTRGEVTGGQHLNGIGELLISVIEKIDDPALSAHFNQPFNLPGYYRAQKKWDIVVTKGTHVLAAIELKSQSGSFGNNLNNRAEEVLGLSKDFWVAYREKAFGVSPQPWLGYFFMLEDAPKSRTPVSLMKSCFPPMEVFASTSYMDRYRILCERLILERDYSATALIAAPKNSRTGEHYCPSENLSPYRFAKSLYHHLQSTI